MTDTAQAIHRRLIDDHLADGRSEPLQRDQVTEFVRSRYPLLTQDDREDLADHVLALANGLGPLHELMEDDLITEIMVNGPGNVLIEKDGRIAATDIVLNLPEVEHIIERVVAPLGLNIDRRQPFGDARLADGTRVNIVVPPLALDGPYITFRRFRAKKLPLEEFTTFGTASLLRWLVRTKANIVISGGTGTGKTTLLNALAAAIPLGERIVTIEDAAELQLESDHVVRLETRPANADGVGAVDARALVRNALRMRPDRIIIGEARGSEVLDMLQAMNTGHEGSLSTCHANSAADAMRRLEMMVLLHGSGLSLEAIRSQLAASVDVIVHLARTSEGRRITAVAEVSKTSEAKVQLLADEAGLFKLPRRQASEPPDERWLEAGPLETEFQNKRAESPDAGLGRRRSSPE